MLCRVDGTYLRRVLYRRVVQADALLLVSLKPPLMQMLCCCECVGPVHECFAASMVVVFGGCFAARCVRGGCLATTASSQMLAALC
jgi:hypothetical protein